MAESCATSCETTCETGAENVCDLDLYTLFPWIVRYRDAFATADVEVEGNLKKITYALEQEFCVTETDIAGLAELIDADACDADFLLFLSATVGTMVGADPEFSEREHRWLVKNLVAINKIKGTHFGWNKHTYHLFRAATLDFWYHAWELWKTVPYEDTAWYRSQGYYALLKAARYDLYYLEGGQPVYLTPSVARELLPYFDSVRPVHVIPRVFVQKVALEDSVVVPWETYGADCICQSSCQAGCEAGPCELSCQSAAEVGSNVIEFEWADYPPDIESELFLEVDCQSTCEAGSCEGVCELYCMASCEFACQAGCQFSTEVIYPDYCDIGCRSSCEGGSCEGGSCQVGSCQGGCEGCSQLQKFPALVMGVGGGGFAGRVYFPHQGMSMPPSIHDLWWISPDSWPYFYLQWEGTGMPPGPMPPLQGTYTPDILSHWVEVTCVKPNVFTEVHSVMGNGVNTLWTGTLDFPPHPCSVWFEAVLEEYTTTAQSAGPNVLLVADVSGLTGGDVLQIRDTTNAETNQIDSIVGSHCYLRCPLRNTYSAPFTVYRRGGRMVAHTQYMATPGTGDTTWYGVLGGDVNPGGTNLVNHRGGYEATVTWRRPPQPGAVIYVHYFKEATDLMMPGECVYWIEQMLQGLDTDVLEVGVDPLIPDRLGKLTFKTASLGQVWFWDGAGWALSEPISDADKFYVLMWNKDAGDEKKVQWIELDDFVCPE